MVQIYKDGINIQGWYNYTRMVLIYNNVQTYNDLFIWTIGE